MKKFLSLVLICVQLLYVSNKVEAQISEGGSPPSFEYTNLLKSELSPVEIPINFSVEDLKIVDAWKVNQGAPLKVATLIKANLNPDNSGEWFTLPNNEMIWQLRIQAKGAIALMLYYNNFFIPEGGKLFIYNIDRTQVLGAYTSKTNPPTKKFATEFVSGDDIILEYAVSPNGEKPRIEIENIGYGYNHLYVRNNLKNTGPGTSGSCMVNINCEEGDAWQNEKKGVCKMIQRIGNETFLCSASLVNNTAEDLKPYILSAFHCSRDLNGNPATTNDYNQWVFYFNYEKEGCDNTSFGSLGQTMVGCSRKVAIPINGGSDGLLLLLNQQIPDSYNVYYNGWDRSGTPSNSGVGIHHPSGDYKKISTYQTPITSSTWYSDDNEIGATDAHWEVTFAPTTNGYGVTEGGSSGSPLFSQEKLIIGTLTGGSATCDDPNGLTLYGKLYDHWDKYTTADTGRIDVWLDPLQKGVTTLSGRFQEGRKPAPTNLNLIYHNQTVELTWTAPVSSEAPTKYLVYKNNTSFGDTENLSYEDNAPQTGSQIYSVSAMYSDGSESEAVSKSIFITEYKAPTDLKATYTSGSEVSLEWREPTYQQTITWSNELITSYYSVSAGNTPFYFGQLWSATEIAPLNKKQLIAIEFIPQNYATYSVHIQQGNNIYNQAITETKPNEENTILLGTPFVIDGTQDLVVSIYVESHSATVAPATCDQGPAINGKGNLISMDGTNWNTLYDNNASLNYNFILAALVSSEDGDLSTQQILPTEQTTSSLNNKAIIHTKSLKSQQPSTFPEITGYNLYRNDMKINSTPIMETNYVDRGVNNGTYHYQVTAMYGNEEGIKSSSTEDISVSIESIDIEQIGISPIPFKDYIRIRGSELVNQLEIISFDGKLIQRIEHPENTINTDYLPSGIYILRLYMDKEVKSIRAIKQ